MRTTTVIVGSQAWIDMWKSFYMVRAEKFFARLDKGKAGTWEDAADWALQMGFASLLEAAYWSDKRPWT